MTDRTTVLLPSSLEEAASYRARYPDVVPIAGGTDVMVDWHNVSRRHGGRYLDLSGLAELRSVRWRESEVEIGATVTYWDTLRDERLSREIPLLRSAARTIGALQIQARGTWAGNVANGSPVADGVVALMALGAKVVLCSSSGERRVPLSNFYTGYKQNRMRPDELIQSLIVPRETRRPAFFEKVAARQAQAISILAVAVTRSASEWRVVAGGMAPTVRRCAEIEALLESVAIENPDQLLPAIGVDLAPIDDLRATARYRTQVMARLLYWHLRASGDSPATDHAPR